LAVLGGKSLVPPPLLAEVSQPGCSPGRDRFPGGRG